MMGLFDQLNELNIQVVKETSSKDVVSDKDSFWSLLWSFKWIDQGLGKIPALTARYHGALSWNKTAYQKLGANQALRDKALDACAPRLRTGHRHDQRVSGVPLDQRAKLSAGVRKNGGSGKASSRGHSRLKRSASCAELKCGRRCSTATSISSRRCF